MITTCHIRLQPRTPGWPRTRTQQRPVLVPLLQEGPPLGERRQVPGQGPESQPPRPTGARGGLGSRTSQPCRYCNLPPPCREGSPAPRSCQWADRKGLTSSHHVINIMFLQGKDLKVFFPLPLLISKTACYFQPFLNFMNLQVSGRSCRPKIASLEMSTKKKPSKKVSVKGR